MLSVSRVIGTISGAHFINRATSLARAIRSKVGRKKEILDGYLIEGSRSNNNLRASVIDLPGDILLVRRSQELGGPISLLSCGGRDAFSPFTGSMKFTIGEERPYSFNYLIFGEDPFEFSDLQETSLGYAQPGAHAIYFSGTYKSKKLRWMSVIARHVGAPDYTRSFTIDDASISSMAYGYQLGSDTWSEALPVVTERGKFVYVAVRVIAKAPIITTQEEAILLMRLDAEQGLLAYKIVKNSMFPPLFRIQEIANDSRGFDGEIETDIQLARNRITITDCDILPDGVFVAAFMLEIDMQDSSVSGLFIEQGFRHRTGVICGGSVTWSGSGVDVKIYINDCDATIDSQLVRDLQLDIDSVRNYGVPLLRGSDVHNNSRVSERKNGTPMAGLKPVHPFSEERINGEVVATAAADGFGYMFEGAAFQAFGGIYIGSNVNRATVSNSTVALPRAAADADQNIRISSGVGIMFTDGERFKYEQISEIDKGMYVFYLTPTMISCPQQEVRGADGSLTSCSVVLASAIRGGVLMLGVRKGPIWDEDFKDEDAEKTYEDYWSWGPIPKSDVSRAPFYIGGPFNTKPHGAIFHGK